MGFLDIGLVFLGPLQSARDVVENLFVRPSIIAHPTDRTKTDVVDGHVVAVELNDARFDDDIVVTAINQSCFVHWYFSTAMACDERT